ncbi:MAG: hypothetical protein LQ340_002566, partial [Diploschistes diacapsis]
IAAAETALHFKPKNLPIFVPIPLPVSTLLARSGHRILGIHHTNIVQTRDILNPVRLVHAFLGPQALGAIAVPALTMGFEEFSRPRAWRSPVRVGKEEFRLALFEDALVAFVPEFRVFPNLVLSGRGPAGPELQDLLYRGLRDQFAGCRATRPAFRKTRTPTQRKMVSKRSCGTAKRCETKTSDAMRVFECLAEEVSRSSRALMDRAGSVISPDVYPVLSWVFVTRAILSSVSKTDGSE